MGALVKGDVRFPVSNQAWIDLRSYVWWSSATTGSSIRAWEIGHSMYLGHSSNMLALVVPVVVIFQQIYFAGGLRVPGFVCSS